jgi:hypothetical protein
VASLTIEIVGADKLSAGMSKAAGSVLPSQTRKAMDASLLLIEADARRNVKQDTRRLANSIHPNVTGSGANLTGEVGPSVKYGLYVERGRPAGRKPPPVSALRGWASRHGIPKGALYIIAKRIGERGIKPAPFLLPAYEKNRGRITDLFAKIGLKVVEAARG